MKRRDFIHNSLFATIGTTLIPTFLKEFELNFLNQRAFSNKKLIIIQFSGGNDGLNMVVPFNNDIYYKSRPVIGIPKANVLTLNSELGLNPVMKGLKSIYDQGFLTVINNVGYPNPNRSHFRSMDIWQTASDSNQYLSNGWIGRYLDAQCNGADCKMAHEAIEVDDTLGLALKGEKFKGLALKDPQKLYKVTQTKEFKALAALQNNHAKDSNASYLYKTLAETVSSASYIYEKSKVFQSKEIYPQNDFGKRLKTISELINSGVETNVYYASLGSFDTHVNQKPQQERLLQAYSDAMEVFVKDLKTTGKLDDVVIMTFSEFGRRVGQNASNGTDHGTASNVFVITGKPKKAGVFNEGLDLANLDDGDLKYSVDFREIYTTLLDKHLEADAKMILGKNFKALELV